MHARRIPVPDVLPTFGVALLLVGVTFESRAQVQSLAFTGGVLLNASVNFRNLGTHPSTSQPGLALGSVPRRTYDNGYVNSDPAATDGTTADFGYLSTSQIGSRGLTMSSVSAAGNVSVDDASSFVAPSGNLEYRGSLGEIGRSDWGLLLGIGYQSVNAEISEAFTTDASVLEDRYDLGPSAPSDFPPAPYSGSLTSSGPRIGSLPQRSTRIASGGRTFRGHYDFDAELIPITGGFYLESQLAGRLNSILSAGVLVMMVNAELRYQETSTVGVLPAVRDDGADGSNDYVWGGFVQWGLDWALWDDASLVAGARWQPTQTFDHSVEGRTAEIDFTLSFAVHAGFALRF